MSFIVLTYSFSNSVRKGSIECKVYREWVKRLDLDKSLWSLTSSPTLESAFLVPRGAPRKRHHSGAEGRFPVH